jgi:hypothetical protein
VFLNFDGATIHNGQDSNATTDTTWIAFTTGACAFRESVVIPPFDAQYWREHGSRPQIIQTVASLLAEVYAGYNIRFVTTRPASGHYTMTVIGGACLAADTLCQAPGVLGVSPVDCSDEETLDVNRDDINFVCSDSVSAFGLDLLTLAYIIAHEDAHTFGLAHVERPDDIMYYAPDQSGLRSWGAGDIRAGATTCSASGFQDDGAYLSRAIGGSGLSSDATPPPVRIDWPPAGAVLPSGLFEARVSASDPSGIAEVELLVNGSSVERQRRRPFVFVVASSTSGPLELTATAQDWFGYAGMAAPVTVTIDQPPSSCQQPSDCDLGLQCRSGMCSTVPIAGATGADCAVNADCQSEACIHAAQSYCTQTCDSVTPCPDGYACQTHHCLAGGMPPGATGWPCSAAVVCRTGLCWDAAADGFCTQVCEPAGAACPNGSACMDSGDGAGTFVCGRPPGLPPPTAPEEPPASGCGAARRSPTGCATHLAALTLVACLLDRRRARPRGGPTGAGPRGASRSNEGRGTGHGPRCGLRPSGSSLEPQD